MELNTNFVIFKSGIFYKIIHGSHSFVVATLKTDMVGWLDYVLLD